MSKLIVCGEEINDDFQFALYSKSHTKYRIELDSMFVTAMAKGSLWQMMSPTIILNEFRVCSL